MWSVDPWMRATESAGTSSAAWFSFSTLPEWFTAPFMPTLTETQTKFTGPSPTGSPVERSEALPRTTLTFTSITLLRVFQVGSVWSLAQPTQEIPWLTWTATPMAQEPIALTRPFTFTSRMMELGLQGQPLPPTQGKLLPTRPPLCSTESVLLPRRSWAMPFTITLRRSRRSFSKGRSRVSRVTYKM